MATLLDLFLASATGLVALLLALATLASFVRSRHRRLAFVTLAFLLFAAKGAWGAATMLWPVGAQPSTFALAVDAGTVALLYLALLLPTRG